MHCVFLDLQTFAQHINLDEITGHVRHFTSYQATDQTQLLERCKNADIVITNKVVFDRQTLAQLPYRPSCRKTGIQWVGWGFQQRSR